MKFPVPYDASLMQTNHYLNAANNTNSLVDFLIKRYFLHTSTFHFRPSLTVKQSGAIIANFEY